MKISLILLLIRKIEIQGYNVILTWLEKIKKASNIGEDVRNRRFYKMLASVFISILTLELSGNTLYSWKGTVLYPYNPFFSIFPEETTAPG